MSNRFILHSNTPSFDEMTCIICSIDNEEKHDRSAISNFHWQILKCRMLIFSTSKLIVSPEATDISKIIIIFQRKTMNIQKLQMILDKLSIKVILSMEVNPKLFEACYKYTLSAKLSPSWNLMETNLFISGRDFLTNQQPSDAVILNINVSGEMVTLEVKCFKVRLGQMKIDNLNILQRNSDYFSNTPDASLSEMSLLDQWIHVIPSMKKGRLISVNKIIPVSSPFNTYKDLKRHWKNIYGYRLPESDIDLIYYEVHFRPLGPNLYTYPSICLRPGPPLLTPPTQIHAREILDKFLTDLQNRMSSAFNNMKFDFPDSHPVKLPMTNIENAPKPDDFTNYKHQEHLVEDMFSDINFNDNWNAPLDYQVANATQHISLCTPTQNTLIEVEKKEEVSRIKPVFISKRLTQKTNIIELTSNDKCIRNIEIISSVDTNEKGNNIFESNAWPDENDIASSCAAKKIIIPTFSSKISKGVKFNKTPTIKTKATPKPKVSNKSTVKKVTPSVINTVKEIRLSQEIKSKPSFSSQTLDGAVHISDQSSLTQISLVELDGMNLSSQSSLNSQKAKRKIESGKPVVPKKQKQEVNLAAIDIPGLAMRDMSALKKLNAQTLIAWLRSQNIPTTSRMLKQQLLDKVLEKLQINQAPMMPV